MLRTRHDFVGNLPWKRAAGQIFHSSSFPPAYWRTGGPEDDASSSVSAPLEPDVAFSGFIADQGVKFSALANADRSSEVPPMLHHRSLPPLLSTVRKDTDKVHDGGDSSVETLRSHAEDEMPLGQKLPFYRRCVDGLLTDSEDTGLTELQPLVERPYIPNLHHGLTKVLFKYVEVIESHLYSFTVLVVKPRTSLVARAPDPLLQSSAMAEKDSRRRHICVRAGLWVCYEFSR